MSLTLYGLIHHDQAVDFGAIGFEGAPVRAIPCGPFAAVVGQPPSVDFKNIPREVLVRVLLSHQTTLEKIMKRFFVLPFKFGTTVRDTEELGDILRGNESFLLSLEKQVKDSMEINVVATWAVSKILQEIAEEDPEISACKKEMANGVGDLASVGMLLAKALKKRAEEWHRKITEALKAHATKNAEHNLLNDQMVLNSSFLIPCQDEKEFFDAVEGINLSFEEKLNFKCIGPLPPYSFATMILKRFDPEEIRKAANVLGLNGEAELMFLKKVYKELSRKCHPDTDPNLSMEKFEELNRAYEIIADYCEDGPKLLEKKAVEKSARLEVMENLTQVHHAA